MLRVAAWARSNWARTTPVVVLIALIVGTAMALAVGTRRTQSAPDRYTTAHGGDPDLLVRQPFGPPLTEQVRAVEGVAAADSITLVAVAPLGGDGQPIMDANVFAGATDAMGTRVLEGRFADGGAPDEFTVDTQMAELMGATVGDRFVMVSLTQEQLDADDVGAGPQGPRLEASLVGIITSPAEFLDSTPTMWLPGAVLSAHPSIGALATDITVFVDDGVRPDDVLARLTELAPGTISDSPLMVGDGARDAVRFQATALWIVTIVALVAAALVAAQIAARHVRSTSGDREPLRALGYRPRQIALEGAIQGAAIGAVSAAAAAVVATMGSALFPLGALRGFEPDPGPRIDGAVLWLGAVGVVVVIATATTFSAVRSAARFQIRSRRSRVADRLADMGATPAQVIGVRFALTRTGRRSVPSFALIAGTAASALGLVGAVVVGASVLRLVNEPAYHGRNYDLVVGNPFLPAARDIVTPAAAEPDVTELTAATVGGLRIEGEDVPVFSFEPVKGALLPVVTRGRAPAAAHEIAFGRVIARRLEVGIGDVAPALLGDGTVVDLDVVGYVVTPDEAGDGAAMTYAGYAALDPYASQNLVLVRLRAGTGDETVTRLSALASTPAIVSAPTPRVASLERVTATPFLLAIVLIVLTVGLLVHDLIAAARSRARDLAMIRALGGGARLMRGTLHWHATTVTVLGLAIGIPLGVLAGRRVFTYIADRLGLVPSANVPTLALLGTAGSVLLVANLAALWPANRAARARPAQLLRRA